MKDIIKNFINSKNALNKYFDCNEDFFINPLLDNKWTLKEDNGIYFLKCFKDDIPKDYIVVKKNNIPMIFEKNDYTMIVAIDCIKLAFLVKNSNKI